MKQEIIQLIEQEITRQGNKIRDFWSNISEEKYLLPSRFVLSGDTTQAIVSEKIIAELNGIINSLNYHIKEDSEPDTIEPILDIKQDENDSIISILAFHKEQCESILIQACINIENNTILSEQVKLAYHLALSQVIQNLRGWIDTVEAERSQSRSAL